MMLRWLVCCVALAVAGCSTQKPWINEPVSTVAPDPQRSADDDRDPTILMAVLFSGGGARAAAFGYGVLLELQANRFEWAGRDTNLLDKVDLVGGVSGGSIVAAYFATHGSARLPRFEREYLRVQIKRFSGNISKTAAFVGMERSALHRKLKLLGISVRKNAMDLSEDAEL